MKAIFFILLILLMTGCGKNKGTSLVEEARRGPPSMQDGDDCSSDRRCDSEVCLQGPQWPRGYCSSSPCDGDCHGDDAFCLAFLDGSSFCMDACERSSDCREYYRCLDVGGGKRACVADFYEGPAPGFHGGECREDFPCNRNLECANDLTGGYCFGPSCDDCIEGTCAELPGVGQVCAQDCDEINDCRPGYLCVDEACVPAQKENSNIPWAKTLDALDVTCGGTKVDDDTYEFTFDLAQNTNAFVLTTFADVGTVQPVSLSTPGQTIDLLTDYVAHNIAGESLASIVSPIGRNETVSFYWAIQFPYAPEFQSLVEPGATYTFRVRALSENPCIYVMEQAAAGTRLRLNIYFTGTELKADAAATDADFQEVLDTVKALFAPAGITIEDTNYYDLPDEIAQRYTVLEDFAGVTRLTSFGDARGESLEDHLTLDVFMVEEIVGNLLGISAGLPGPPGMHGNADNGAVFSVQDIGFDNSFVGYVMAHEIGHYLGLRHTTEAVVDDVLSDIGLVDPFLDTPECASVAQLGTGCPDISNLMFPIVPPTEFRTGEISPDQATTIRQNPFVR